MDGGLRCCNCEFYKSGYMYNACALTESEYFQQQNDCDLVNDDGTVNYESPYFKDSVESEDE